jgi:hypothetical protein
MCAGRRAAPQSSVNEGRRTGGPAAADIPSWIGGIKTVSGHSQVNGGQGGRSHRYTRLHMADDSLFTKVQLQTPQIERDRGLLRDEDLLNEEHLRRMDQVLLRRNLDHARIFSRKYSLELQQYTHLYTPEANELRRQIEKYMVMERMIEREMARRHTY